jgi:glutamate-1-semialdehyde aminotransferase
MLPGPGPAYYRLLEVLAQLYPHTNDLVTFKTGSEAVAAAIRLARAQTGRKTILRVGYLGWHDQVISPYVRCHTYDPRLFEQIWPVGVPHDSLSSLSRVWYGSDPRELVSLVRATGEDLAAVVVDPVQLAPPYAAAAARALKEAVNDSGALLIFDESKTGFRVHMGGVQALYGVAADLTVLSKALANGLPLAVVLGRRELISLARSARIKGTFGAETASIAAALATIQQLQTSDGPRVLDERGGELLEGLNDAIRSVGLQHQVAAVPYQWACLPYVHFAGEAKSLQHPFHDGLVDRGVLMLRNHMSYVPLELTHSDVDAVVMAARHVLRELVASA